MNRAFSAAVEIERIPRALPQAGMNTAPLALNTYSGRERGVGVRWSQAIPERSIAETDLDVARSLNHLAIGRDQPQTIDRIGDGDVADLIVLIADHGAEMPFVD